MHCDYYDAGACRSCALMGRPYADQLAAKQLRVADMLAAARTGIADSAKTWSDVDWLDPVAGPEHGFRNKAKLVAGGRRGAVTLGILDGRRHGVDLRDCGLHEPALAAAIPVLAGFLDDLRIPPYDVPARRGELKHVIATVSPAGELMLRVVLRTPHYVDLLRRRLPELQRTLPGLVVVSVNLLPEHAAVLEGAEEIVLTEADSLAMPVDGLTLQLRPRSFFQTNTQMAGELYAQAREWARARDTEGRGRHTVWDLYCGVGGFGLSLARDQSRRVFGVEVSAEAILGARTSAAELGVAERTTFVAEDATAWALARRDVPDLVVVNPPRRGIGPALAGWLEASDVPEVIYSSCNVDSLAEDLAAMPSLRVASARLFDMFPQTTHHEVMVFLRRA